MKRAVVFRDDYNSFNKANYKIDCTAWGGGVSCTWTSSDSYYSHQTPAAITEILKKGFQEKGGGDKTETETGTNV